MNQFIDITDRAALLNLLSRLKPDTLPLWGKMTPQQMVEHMIRQVRFTNGKLKSTLDVPLAEAAKSKQLWIYTDAQIPRNVVLGTLPPQYEYADICDAINQLMQELDAFNTYFKTPDATAIHGGFGALTHDEWLVWHNKHFTHHLKQFGLI
ncbi:DUF1569 domain-containing protein [Mucilaginibacter segetis]|uniref:DUF1569 domain-containing protein n=1 Tax=Mucilaginibacter segetis TaxID=2793071 RepID=A0A934PTM4_9SPHI|nr:DUF1569 domain-containing protein [Mucilaginibacter segetis]MBK0380613.1 DUF1569 domain-containing protein [Mucilaginibacter segetis]